MSCDFSALGSIDPNDPEQANALLQQCTATLTDPDLWLWLILFTIGCAAVGALIGRRKNTMMRDAILGAALGPIGWIISLCTPAARPKPQCPACKRPVDAGDAHCRHCGAQL
jgi:hypothetical protein